MSAMTIRTTAKSVVAVWIHREVTAVSANKVMKSAMAVPVALVRGSLLEILLHVLPFIPT